jgi:hypothetical protein
MGFAVNLPDGSALPIHIAPPTAPDLVSTSASALAQRMVERLNEGSPKSGAEALRVLRLAFPDSPLTLRVAALNMLMRRNGSSHHIPR